jgi:hypothetical protein
MGNYGYDPYGPPPPPQMQMMAPVPPAQMGYGYACPFCMYQGPAMTKQRISTAGWIVFAVMIIVCLPLFWIGLLMKETVPSCPQCLRP